MKIFLELIDVVPEGVPQGGGFIRQYVPGSMRFLAKFLDPIGTVRHHLREFDAGFPEQLHREFVAAEWILHVRERGHRVFKNGFRRFQLTVGVLDLNAEILEGFRHLLVAADGGRRVDAEFRDGLVQLF